MNEPRDVTPSWVEPMPGDLRTALSAKGDPDAIMRTIREAGYVVVPARQMTMGSLTSTWPFDDDLDAVQAWDAPEPLTP